MRKLKKLSSSMEFNIIGAIILLLVLFAVIVSVFGYLGFTRAIQDEYATTTYHMADTATTLVNGNHIQAYLAGEETEEYLMSKRYLDSYCQRIHVSLVYVIAVDTSDYGRFVSVFNSVDNSVDNSTYTEWELGYKRDTTNDEYREKYEALYAGGTPYETVYRHNPSDGAHPHITTLVPVKDEKGGVTAILCIQRPMREIRDVTERYLIRIAVSALLLALIASFMASKHLKKQVIRPVRAASGEAVRFAKEKTKGKPIGEMSGLEEISNLIASIDTMETDMVNYMRNLTDVTAEKERIGTELSLANMIQDSAIPNVYPAFPDRTEFDIYGSMTPAKEVGGDFYNYFLIDDDHLALMIGDVSGKGVPGALFMMSTNTIVSIRTQTGGTPAEILSFANGRICEHNEADMFITLWLGILEISTGKITAANAGHEDIAVCRKDGRFELLKTRHGIPLGAMPGVRYKDYEFVLNKGDKLFLYTDGLPEATDCDNRMFTLERMLEALNAYRDKTPREILDGMDRWVRVFTSGAPAFDDLTMLCVAMKEDAGGGAEPAP